MNKLAVSILAAAICLAFAQKADAQVAFSGKQSLYLSTGIGGVPLPGAPAPITGGTIAKGKKKRVLECTATVTSGLFAPLAPWSISIGVDVNAIPLDPGTTFPESVVQDCSASAAIGPFTAPAAGCTATGHFLLDIDANPGLINAPLSIMLWASSSAGGPAIGPVDASLACTLAKKK